MSKPTPETEKCYASVRECGGYFRPAPRGLIEVRGADRASWLHNLTTNVVNSLAPGDGNYAFAITAQGRTVFDLNLLVFDEYILLDIDARWSGAALTHLSKYIITDDVTLTDVSPQWRCLELLGSRTATWVEALGFGNNFTAMADLQHVSQDFEGGTIHLVKNNLGPVPRATFLISPDRDASFVKAVEREAGDLGCVGIDGKLFEIIRIEAGVPASVADIDEQVIPPETLQTERGISYVKGCYLGQEVIERMRSRNSMARRLIAWRITDDTSSTDDTSNTSNTGSTSNMGDALPEHDAPVFCGGSEIGRVTSSCVSVALGAGMGLGYAKSALIRPNEPLTVALDAERTTPLEIVDVPLDVWRAV